MDIQASPQLLKCPPCVQQEADTKCQTSVRPHNPSQKVHVISLVSDEDTGLEVVKVSARITDAAGGRLRTLHKSPPGHRALVLP